MGGDRLIDLHPSHEYQTIWCRGCYLITLNTSEGFLSLSKWAFLLSFINITCIWHRALSLLPRAKSFGGRFKAQITCLTGWVRPDAVMTLQLKY